MSGLTCLSSPLFAGAPAEQGSYCTVASCGSVASNCPQAAGNEITCVPLDGYAAGGVAQCICGASALCRYCLATSQCPTGYTCTAGHYCTKPCTTSCDSVQGITVTCVNSECQCGASPPDGGVDSGGGADASDAAPDVESSDAESEGGG